VCAGSKLLREDWADPDDCAAGLCHGGRGGCGSAGQPACGGCGGPGHGAGADGARIVPTGLARGDPGGVRDADPAALGAGAETWVTLPNTPGTIDSDYRGPLGVLLVNFGDAPFVVEHGDRIAQAVIAPVVRASFGLVDTLDATARGAGGFGSTGVG
jgi:dUTP pyrophosphatase